eukprot:Anaeramoba_ignava/a219600_13.p1 GENE.a219600_13~~a219600_13.p1  ORF type:complete len:250 (-),score=14.49 a219600_13:32-781(-)
MNPKFLVDGTPASFLVGGLGAGKTELSLNLSAWNAKFHGKSFLIDLDIVNPFFRVRKLREEITSKGVELVMPDDRVASGDLPALPAAVWGIVGNPENTVVCDVGGGEPGLRPLGRLKTQAAERGANVFFVLNPFRPGFRTFDEMNESFHHFEKLSALKVTHIVANPNLSGETSKEIFDEGFEMISTFSKKVGIPIGFSMADTGLAQTITGEVIEAPGFYQYKQVPLFAIERYWSVPWEFGVHTHQPLGI